jgi:hypothetical protein
VICSWGDRYQLPLAGLHYPSIARAIITKENCCVAAKMVPSSGRVEIVSELNTT